MNLLFKKYSKLKKYISYISLGTYPTPITKFDELNNYLEFNNLYIKRDDLSGHIYGGNKIRKLEFIFADVKKLNKKTVLTFGKSGSNHVLATIIYAKQLGLKCVGMLLPQKNSRYLKKTLSEYIYYGGEIHESRNKFLLALNLFYVIIKILFKDKKLPYIILPGGSSKLGNLGYVNAAFELNEQIISGLIPKPDIIYVPMGSSGTVAGLLLGLKLLNLDIKVIAVRVTDKQYANEKILMKLIKKTNIFLHKIDNDIPIVSIDKDDYVLDENHFAPGYGIFNNKNINAINLFYNKSKIILDGTYTSKVFVAMQDDIISNKNDKKVILFWNTYNSRELPEIDKKFIDKFLPKEFVKYYKKSVQKLDNNIICNIYDKD